MFSTTYYECFRLNFVGFLWIVLYFGLTEKFCLNLEDDSKCLGIFLLLQTNFSVNRKKDVIPIKMSKAKSATYTTRRKKITFNDCFMLFFSSEEFLFSEFISKFIYVRNQQASSSLNMFCSLERIIF